MKVIDLTHEFNASTPVYPGDNKPILIQSNYFTKNKFNNFTLTTDMHTGTHIDGPMHMNKKNKFISEINAAQFVGQGFLIDDYNKQNIEWKPEYDEIINNNSIVLIYTGHSEKFYTEKYFTDHPEISENFAEKLVSKKIKLLGLDFPSPDFSPFPVHKILMNSEIMIAENLTNLDKLKQFKNFIVAALPLKIRADSAPARIVAISD